MQRITAAYSRQPIKASDVGLALTIDGEDALARLSRASMAESAVYSKHATQRLLAEKLRLLKAAALAAPPDTAAMDAELRGLVSDEEAATFNAIQQQMLERYSTLPQSVARDESEGVAFRQRVAAKVATLGNNGFGRMLVLEALKDLPKKVAKLPNLDLQAKLQLEPRPQPAQWIAPAKVTEGENPLAAARCVKATDGTFRLDAATRRFITESRGGVLANAAKLSYQRVGLDEGFRLTGFMEDSLLGSCGLFPGDIVVAINGTSLTRHDDAASIYALFLKSFWAKVAVMRGSARREFFVVADPS